MEPLGAAVERVALESGFSGTVRVDRAGETVLERAYGLADRARGVPMTVGTQLPTASITKGLTALAVMALVERGTLSLQTTAREWLGDDLPLVPEDVTVEQLLGHRSGIGDYLPEHSGGDITDHVLAVPVHTLVSSEDWLPVLEGHPVVSRAGEQFAYNNGGYVLLALLAERAAGTPYHELVRTLVTEPAGMTATAFLRSDELPGGAALGYLHREGLRINVLHLPVVGSGDGGAYSTVADLAALWTALYAGRVVSLETLALMVEPRSDWPEEDERFGLGFHLGARGDEVWLEGYDAGVSCLSQHQPSTGVTWTVMSNWSQGAWPLMGLLGDPAAWAEWA